MREGEDEDSVVMAFYQVFDEMSSSNQMMDDLADQFGSTGLNDGYWD